MDVLTQIKQVTKNLWDGFQAHRHYTRLGHHVDSGSYKYEQYLKAQLRRTISKINMPLPAHSRRLMDKTAELIDLTCCAVLCVGCRNIAEIDYFREKGTPSVVGIDLFSQSTEILIMDMHAMTFEADAFDLIYSSHSLEHAFNLEQVIGEFVRTVRDGGIIVIEVPVHYDIERTGADLVDFGSLDNLHQSFKPYLDQVLWSETSKVSGVNDMGTETIRTIIQIRKYG